MLVTDLASEVAVSYRFLRSARLDSEDKESCYGIKKDQGNNKKIKVLYFVVIDMVV